MYQNGKAYLGTFAGVKVTFTLQNFSQKVVEKFNEALVKEVKHLENRGGQYSRVSS
jgi:hypothetical protein